MMYRILIVTLNLILVNSLICQCEVDYIYSGSEEILTFTNQSTVSNAHFYWNFGDGSGSNEDSPIHVFPDDGKYLVTLYGIDTLTNCTDVSENWIDIEKPDTLDCNIFFTDTIIGSSPQTTNLSTDCFGYNLNCHVFANAQGICNGFSCGGCQNYLALHGMQATSNDSIYGYRIFNAYYETFPLAYSSSTNYEDCSANFEMLVDYQSDGALVSFTAMNKSGNSTFSISGFGNSINMDGFSGSFLYPYISNKKVTPWTILHLKSDSLNGCPLVTCSQTVLIHTPNYTWPPNCVISRQPQTQFIQSGTTGQFIIDAPSNVAKQWQQDAGLGFMNLTNAGPFSGVTTDTLSISNVQLTMNNFHYRCLLSVNSGFGCHNTSNIAILNVSETDISENSQNVLNIYPNPVTEALNVSAPARFEGALAKVFDLSGKVVLSIQFEIDKGINVSSLSSGMYLLELRKDEYVGRSTFIKK